LAKYGLKAACIQKEQPQYLEEILNNRGQVPYHSGARWGQTCTACVSTRRLLEPPNAKEKFV
jgi:hypothetical protein